MKTIIRRIDSQHPQKEIIEEAGAILRRGGLVAFPTETVYGLGGDALDAKASEKIYAAKGRPSDNPLIVHIARMEDLDRVVQSVPEKARILARRYWPGPLTMILPKSSAVPYETTGRGWRAWQLRYPSHPVAQALILAGGGFVAAPSANTSGRPSPTTAAHVEEDLSGAVDMILDGGQVGIGIESTIVDFTETVPTVLRPGVYFSGDAAGAAWRGEDGPGASEEQRQSAPEGARYEIPSLRAESGADDCGRQYRPGGGLH